MTWSKLAVACACAFLVACSSNRAPSFEPPRLAGIEVRGELSMREVARGAYLVTHRPFFSANVLAVLMPDGTLVICSSPLETEATRHMLAWLDATLHPKAWVAINTHFHFDGTGGNEAYASWGVRTYASDQTQALLRERGEHMRNITARSFRDENLRARIARMKIALAENVFDARTGLALDFGGERVNVSYPGPAHAPDNVVVFFPARGVLFGGCMVKVDDEIGYTGDADLAHWETALRHVESFRPTVVVPGHGDPGGADLLRHTAALVARTRARRAISRGAEDYPNVSR